MPVNFTVTDSVGPTITITSPKDARRALRKAHTLDLLAEVLASQAAHGDTMNLLQSAINEHTTHQMRLSGSVWARVKWIAVGK